GGLERAPVAAVDEDRERRSGVRIVAGEIVVDLPRARAVGDAELGLAAGRFAIGGCLAVPARENLGMLFDPAAVVVFFFVIDRRHHPSPIMSTTVSRGFS